jgi:hypothetical protein
MDKITAPLFRRAYRPRYLDINFLLLLSSQTTCRLNMSGNKESRFIL